jgi:drug/metabolite transporter (DMT)-like permease
VTVDEDATPAPAEVEPRAWLPIAAAGVTVVLWSSAFVAVRFVGEEISPGPLALGRLLVGSLVLGVVLLPRPRLRPSRGDWTLLLLCGSLWFGVYNVALNAAEQRIDAGTAAMLVNIGPLLIAVLAGFLLGEGFPRQLIGGSLVAFAGVVVIGVATSSGKPETVGVLLSVLAAAAYAVGVVAQKSLLNRLPGLQVTWIACTVGTVCCLPFAPDLLHEVAGARTSTVAWLVYLGVFPTALAFTTWAYALNRTSAGRMANTTYLVPPLTILLGWVALGEAPVALAYVGGALCLLGVWLSRRRRAG